MKTKSHTKQFEAGSERQLGEANISAARRDDLPPQSFHGSTEWVEKLWRRWENRLNGWERMRKSFDSRTKLACDVLAECITELRMQSRGDDLPPQSYMEHSNYVIAQQWEALERAWDEGYRVGLRYAGPTARGISERERETATNLVELVQSLGELLDSEYKRCKQTQSQLLAAQAAIEMAIHELRHANSNIGTRAEVAAKLESFNPSILHQHDAEVRKPLVEALERIFLLVDEHSETAEAIKDAALAQCKEGEK